jgi:hypothetical protein
MFNPCIRAKIRVELAQIIARQIVSPKEQTQAECSGKNLQTKNIATNRQTMATAQTAPSPTCCHNVAVIGAPTASPIDIPSPTNEKSVARASGACSE